MGLELLGGLAYLLLGGDLLVRGSVALARRAQIPPLLVGLTVVAFGTSAPELCISLGAVFQGQTDISIGNVVGSNIANVLLVLGLPALIYPTLCNQDSVGREAVRVLAASLLFVFFCFLGPLGRLQGGVMVAMLLAVMWSTARSARRGESPAATDGELEGVLGLPTRRRMIALFLLLGVVLLPLGADLMLGGATKLAAALGVSSAVIGLTVMALGTSLPELSTTVIAAFKRHSDLAIGNVLGSNLFNLLAIMGITALVAPDGIPVPPSFLRFDLFVMLASTGLLVWFAWRRSSIGLGYGMVLVAGYGLYVRALFGAPLEPLAALTGR